jgi:hypothetical protein
MIFFSCTFRLFVRFAGTCNAIRQYRSPFDDYLIIELKINSLFYTQSQRRASISNVIMIATKFVMADPWCCLWSHHNMLQVSEGNDAYRLESVVFPIAGRLYIIRKWCDKRANNEHRPSPNVQLKTFILFPNHIRATRSHLIAYDHAFTSLCQHLIELRNVSNIVVSQSVGINSNLAEFHRLRKTSFRFCSRMKNFVKWRNS